MAILTLHDRTTTSVLFSDILEQTKIWKCTVSNFGMTSSMRCTNHKKSFDSIFTHLHSTTEHSTFSVCIIYSITHKLFIKTNVTHHRASGDAEACMTLTVTAETHITWACVRLRLAKSCVCMHISWTNNRLRVGHFAPKMWKVVIFFNVSNCHTLHHSKLNVILFSCVNQSVFVSVFVVKFCDRRWRQAG